MNSIWRNTVYNFALLRETKPYGIKKMLPRTLFQQDLGHDEISNNSYSAFDRSGIGVRTTSIKSTVLYINHS